MTPQLITDPAALAQHPSPAARFVAAFAARGTRTFIANATSRMALLEAGLVHLPVSVDDGGYGRSYVASPHSAYVLYAREEIDLVGMQQGRRAALAALGVLDGVLRAVQFNRAVHVDNWLLSTNLHGHWQGEGLPAIRAALAAQFPEHFLVLRTLDAWSCPQLLEAVRADGWLLLPARQIWVTDDMATDWVPRRACLRDRDALVASGLTVEEIAVPTPADCTRIAELYALLYLDRYSRLNPDFTPDFIRLLGELGVLTYRVARDAAGTILAVAGMLERAGVMTATVVGYDTARPQSEALYRIATLMFSERALARGLRLHGSAGAASFKRGRGARGVIEYLAVDARHLSAPRRMVVAGLARALERFVVPMMQKEGW